MNRYIFPSKWSRVLWACIPLVALLWVACEPPRAPEPPPPPPPEPAVEIPQPTRSPHDAARHGDVEQLELHARLGLDIDLRDAFGATLLHEAASAGQEDIVEWLLERGADVQARDESGFGPVELASFMDHQAVVDILIAHGAELELFDPFVEEEWIDDAVDIDELVEDVVPEIELPEGWADLEFRTWTSAGGQTVEAAFIELQQDLVTLGTPDGRVSRVPITHLSREDQIRARELSGARVAAPTRPGARTVADTGPTRVTAGFSSDCERMLIRAIQQAREEVLVAIYTLTRPQIEQALSRAAQRGVNVQVKYDAKQLPISRMQELIDRMEARGVIMTPIEMSGRYASMHHKFAIVDGVSVFTGSFNFTVMAVTQNYENCVLIESAAVAREFSREFGRIRGR